MASSGKVGSFPIWQKTPSILSYQSKKGQTQGSGVLMRSFEINPDAGSCHGEQGCHKKGLVNDP